MATTPTPDTTPPALTLTQDQFIELIKSLRGASAAEIAAAVQSAAPVKAKSYGQYRREQLKDKAKLDRPFFENGQKIQPYQLKNEEINEINKLHRSGRYLDRLVEVRLRNEGADEAVEVWFNNGSADARFELKGHAKNATDMYQQINAAQVLEDAEDEERESRGKASPGRRHFGDSKASKEARERVAQEAEA